MLKVKAREFSNDPNFKASQGWLDNFKTRFAIKCLELHGIKSS